MQKMEENAVRGLLPRREEQSAKWSFGRAMLVCGSASMPGAALLSAEAALRSGAGLVQLASAEKVLENAAVRLPECLQLPLPQAHGFPGVIHRSAEKAILENAARAQAVLFGCGCGISDHGRALLNALLTKYTGTLVLDADALNLLAEAPERLAFALPKCILTPHLREFCRLTRLPPEEAARAPEQAAAAFAKTYGVTLALKGSTTLVTDGAEMRVLSAPNSGMAKGGSGDVLAGLTAGLAAQMPDRPFDALTLAVWLHSRAGRLTRREKSARAMLPGDVLERLPEAFLELEHPLF